jgi:peptidoglycan-N-acetylglucosamine deacetylase
MPSSTVCLSFDFDALSVWFSYEQTSPNMLQRGEYGARVGVPRLLDLLRAEQIRATFFIPGHTVESYPDETLAILEAGHEIAHHSYAHVAPSEQTPDEERRDMERALAALAAIGVRPAGYRAPGDHSLRTLELLEEYGFRYDSSYKGDDYRPYRPRIGDRVNRDEPLVRGRVARLWELPTSYEFDDWAHFQFNFSPYRNGTSAPSKVLEIWCAELDWMDAHVEGGVLTALMHPQVIGRGSRMAFITHARERGARFQTMADVAAALEEPGI